MKLGLYARVSTHEQQTLALQREAMAAYAQQRRGSIVLTVEEVGSGVSERRQRDTVMRAARRREQTASAHYVPLWGMKPTVLEQRNLLDLHTLILTHEGLLTRRHAALGGGQADISQTRSSAFRTEVKDVGSVPFSVNVRYGIL